MCHKWRAISGSGRLNSSNFISSLMSLHGICWEQWELRWRVCLASQVLRTSRRPKRTVILIFWYTMKLFASAAMLLITGPVTSGRHINFKKVDFFLCFSFRTYNLRNTSEIYDFGGEFCELWLLLRSSNSIADVWCKDRNDRSKNKGYHRYRLLLRVFFCFITFICIAE